MSERSDSQPRVLLVDDNPAFVENLAEILQGQGYAVESAGTCGSALERTILEDFMQFARPTQFVSQPVDLQAVARKVYSLLKHDADQRGIRFECTSSERTRVLGHEERLRQVIVNLALNALDAAPAGGWVRLICDEVEGEVAFSIEDSGPGIQPEVIGRIFEPFFTTKSTGSGLGLSIVHTIVTQHSGTIHAENIPGAGARFTARLPSAHP